MRVVVVCTGNIARSPALEILLRLRRPDLQVESAGVGVHAQNGLAMRRPMRELAWEAGYGEQANAHRSRRWDALENAGGIDLAVGVAPVHMRRLEELAPGVRRVLTVPKIADPAYGDREGYLVAWEAVIEAAKWLADMID